MVIHLRIKEGLGDHPKIMSQERMHLGAYGGTDLYKGSAEVTIQGLGAIGEL
jgi:hypothetical protein